MKSWQDGGHFVDPEQQTSYFAEILAAKLALRKGKNRNFSQFGYKA